MKWDREENKKLLPTIWEKISLNDKKLRLNITPKKNTDFTLL